MSLENELKYIDWERLFREFEGFEADEASCRIESSLFERSLLQPAPAFVEDFVARKSASGCERGEIVRALYCFLLQKRYDERLNLLHFAFNIFDDNTFLPDEIIDRTPFPHEDGIPRFRHFTRTGGSPHS